jgi:hypothetical protein
MKRQRRAALIAIFTLAAACTGPPRQSAGPGLSAGDTTGIPSEIGQMELDTFLTCCFVEGGYFYVRAKDEHGDVLSPVPSRSPVRPST